MKKVLMLMIFIIAGCSGGMLDRDGEVKALAANDGYKMHVYGPYTYEWDKERVDTIMGAEGIKVILELSCKDEGKGLPWCSISLNGCEVISGDEIKGVKGVYEKEIELTDDENLLTVNGLEKGRVIQVDVYAIYREEYAKSMCPVEDTVVDEETGEEVILKDPYYPIFPDDETMERIKGIEEGTKGGGSGEETNNVNFHKAYKGYLITSGHRRNARPPRRRPPSPGRIYYVLTHSGMARFHTTHEYNMHATIHAHPDCGGVKRTYWYFWRHGYACCIIDRIDVSSTKRSGAIQYADAQLNEPYSYRTYVWKFYTDKWCCTSLVWRAYKEQGVSLLGWWFDHNPRAPTPKELMNCGLAKQRAASYN